MKISSSPFQGCRKNLGFNLVEATLSLGILSFGLVTLAPLMAVGLNTTRIAHTERDSSQIAQTLVENARQGNLTAGAAYFDREGQPCAAGLAIFSTESSFSPLPENPSLSRLKITVTPARSSLGARTYVVVLAPSS